MAASALMEKGWHLTEEGIAECIDNGNNKTAQAIIKAALDSDIRHIGEKYLPDDINRGRVDYIEGPCVLQVQKIRNVSAPKDNEESQAAPRLLKLTLTDGHNTCSGVEMETIHTVSLNTPPGTKIQFSGTIPIENGFLQLNSRNTKCIGGRVEKLVENWELKRRLAKQHRRTGIMSEGGPPLFVPFGQKVTKAHIRTDNFKSLDFGKEKKESEEFEMQRRATIAEAVQAKEEGKAKTFGGSNKQALNDKDVARLVDMGFGMDQVCQALRQNNGNVNDAIGFLLGKGTNSHLRDGPNSRGNSNAFNSGQLKNSAKLGGEKPEKFHGRERRGRKKNEEKEPGNEDVAPSRPSGPATLFDFLETKIPIKDESKSHSDRKSSDFKKDTHSENNKFDVDGRQNSDSRKASGNRRNNLPPRLSGKTNASNSGGHPGSNSHGNFTSKNYSSGSAYDNSGDSGSGSTHNSLPFSNSTAHSSGYTANNSGHEYSSGNHGNQQQNRYGSNQTNYNKISASSAGIIGNHQNYNTHSHQQGGSGNFRNAPSGGDSIQGNTHGPNHAVGNNTSSHYQQSQHRYSNNNNNNNSGGSTPPSHNKMASGYQSNYHSDPRQSGITQNTSMRSTRNFSTNLGQGTTAQTGYFNVSTATSSPQQHYTNEMNPGRYTSYNPKDPSHHNPGSDQLNKNPISRDYPNHRHPPPPHHLKQQQFNASVKTPRKILSNLNINDPNGNDGRHYLSYEAPGNVSSGRTGHNYNSSNRPKGVGEIGGVYKKQVDVITNDDNKYQERKNNHSPNTVSHQWRKGDHCLAKYWEDKKFYPAIIESVPDLPTCVVTFIEYGNTEEVMLTDIKPLTKNWHEISKQVPNNSRVKNVAGVGQHPQHHHHHHHHQQQQQGFHPNLIAHHSGTTMLPPHHHAHHHPHQTMAGAAQASPMTAATAVAVAAAAAAAVQQQQQLASPSPGHQYAPPGNGGEQQLMMQQSHISTMEFRRGGGGSPYARRMQQQQQQQMVLMQEKMKATQQFYLPPQQRIMKQ